MRVLFLVPYTPNPIRTRPFNLIRALSTLGHEVTVLTLTSGQAGEIDAEVLRQYAARVIARPLSRTRALANSLAALAGDEPLQAAYCWQPALANRLRRLLREETFDIIHVEHLRGARYGTVARKEIAAAGLPTPVVWDSVDSISHLFRQAATNGAGRLSRLIARLELPRTERYEGRILDRFDMTLTTSPVDRAEFMRLAGHYRVTNSPIHVLPNGVDLDMFEPVPASERNPMTLVVSGKMSYHANVAMVVYLVREIMPLVWAARPDVQLQIVGKDPTVEVQSLAGDSRVLVTGEVPHMQSYLSRAAVAVAPIVYSAGIQNKILEGMACATPVVTTSIALQGLAAEPGRQLLVADEKEETAEAIIGLLDNVERRAAIGYAGREYVEHNHDWRMIAGRLVRYYEDLLVERFSFATD